MAERSPRAKVLLIDDQLEMAEMLAEGLVDRGYEALAVGSGHEAAARLERDSFDAVVTDLRMQPVDGFAVLARSRELNPDRPVIIMTAYSAIDSAVEAIRLGAYHYLAKPFKIDELVIFLERALDTVRVRREAIALRRALCEQIGSAGMIGRSKSMRAVFDVIGRIADSRVSILVTGETGTGKGLVAAAIHGASRRASGPFISINCAAIPEQLLESELFGHTKGAFTGATESREGLFAEADGGTLFLDEIGEMSVALQAKLLHAIEHNRMRPIGSSKDREIDVRIVAATHRDLAQRVAAGTFREDLLYRLDVVRIELPPLRSRPEDVPDLVAHFFAEAKLRHPHSRVARLSREALARLIDHRWPGNVRELSHVIERIVLLGQSEEVGADELPIVVRSERHHGNARFSGEIVTMREMQRSYAAWSLEQTGGVRSRAAEKLDIDIKTLGKLLSDEVVEAPKS